MHIRGLHSLVKVTKDQVITPIAIDEYDHYAPAVIAIYEAIEQMPKSD